MHDDKTLNKLNKALLFTFVYHLIQRLN